MRLRHRYWAVLLLLISVEAAGQELRVLEAVKTADPATLRAALATADANAADVDGTTALHWAVHLNDLAATDLLLQAGARVEARNRYDVTPLMLACVNGSAAIVERLLAGGANVNNLFASGETVLMTAARTGQPEVVRLLLSKGAEVGASNKATGQTALMWAAARNNVEAIGVLLAHGADVNARTQRPSPMGQGRAQRFSYAAAAPTGFTALTFAARAGKLEAVRTILDAGASANETLSDGTSALVLASINGHWDVASLLLDRGANPNAAAQGWTALHQIVKTRTPNFRGRGTPGPIPTGHLNSIDLIKKLLARGADVNARMRKNGMKDGQRTRLNRAGATAFFLAAKGADVEAMRVLLAHGADPLIPNLDGTTPLMVAAGVAVYTPGEDGGTLPGSEPQRLEAVKICVEAGADVNATNSQNETALHGAAYMGSNSVVEYLVAEGSKLDVRNTYGWTPLTIANGVFYVDLFHEQRETATLLRQIMEARGVSPAGQEADHKQCVDCFATRPEQAQAAIERDRKLEEAAERDR